MKHSDVLSALASIGGAPNKPGNTTSCRFCNVGCGYKVLSGESIVPESPDLPIIKLSDGNFVQLIPSSACPSNYGDYSVRGAFLTETLYSPSGPTSDRLQYPMVRVNNRLVRASWQDATDLVANKLKDYVEKDGPESIGFYHADWFGGENAYAYMKLAKLLNVKNYDLNGRLCAASGAAGLTRSLGNGAHPWSIDDINHADTIVLAGANASGTLSVVYDRIFERAQSGAAKLIVIDVRTTLAAENARKYGTFLEIRPGTDVALYNAIGAELIKNGKIDKKFIDAHTVGFDDYRKLVTTKYSLSKSSGLTGITTDQIRSVANIIGRSKATLFLSGKGIEHQAHGTDMVCSLINLALITGSFGKPGGSYSPLGGHQGSIVNPPLFSGELDNVTIPNKTIFQMMDQIDQGTQKALVAACVQPFVTLPHASHFHEIMTKKLEFLVVTDIYPNETTAIADVVFPAASWGEAPYTSTNTDRRVRFYEVFAPAPGEARPDWAIPTEIGRKMGFAKEFNWNSAEEIFDELKAGTPFSGLTYERMRQAGPTNFQMPVPTSKSNGTARLYTDGHFPTPDGRAKIWALDFKPQPEPPSSQYPFVLITGRDNDLWQSGYTFKRIPQLVARKPHNTVLVNPTDARRLGIQDGQLTTVRTRRGAVQIIAEVTERIPAGRLFTLWGYPGSLTNALTIDVRDPISQTPCYKGCAANLAPA
ncbi:molybdopterin oxidoreductase family protein [Acidiphilium sp.]|uniref:molybdopterin oxidoreductase family protein n=1 Tax=Acidiphilium sp. TaxID=527 RepID=UPI003D041EC0